MSKLPFLIVITGPTASGKTALGIALAKEFNGEIISADSRQIYRGMNIGTNKPTSGERAAARHHLLDIKDPDEAYSLADYQNDAIHAIHDIVRRGMLPIMVGGTGLYIKAVTEHLAIPRISADPELRARLTRTIETEGLASLFNQLLARDPDAARVVDPQNPRRVIRALEVAITTGEPFTAQRRTREPLFNTLILGIETPPEILRARIDTRVDHMISAGLVDEVRMLTARYETRKGSLPTAFDTIGYREMVAHLHGTPSLPETIAAIKMNTWHYAKRQMTWFRKTKGLAWIREIEDARLRIHDQITH